MRIRVLEGTSPEGSLKNRVDRVDAVLSKGERILQAALNSEKSGDMGSARILKKRAHDEARMAMRLMGILMVEFGLAMTPQVERARAIALAVKGANGSPSLK